MSEFDPIAALQEAGLPLDELGSDERAVYASLSESEVAVLTGLKTRLTAASGDVEAHSEEVSSGGNFW
jgi:hypothetical protein